MADSTRIHRLSEQEYLQAEEIASVRHEYVHGRIFAMSGSTDVHNLICGNLFSVFHLHLRGTECRAYMNDMKVRIQALSS